jgi:uncharacterized protein YecE (DUF72 family)
MPKWWIGCSGFHYKHWRNDFYPEGIAMKNWFEYYCQHFNAVELNVTFYRFPSVPFLKTFYKRSPEEFRFAVKAPRAITHYKKFVDAADFLSSFYDTVNKGLKEKIGCILFQLHPRTAYSEEKMQQIIDCLDPAFPNVIECRHETWWNDKVYKEFSKNNITFCGISHPTLPDDVIVNNPLVYYRFHGTPELYKTPYPVNFLKHVAEAIKSKRKSKEVFLFFNNDIDVNAPRNAAQMQELTARKTSRIHHSIA